MSNIFTQSVASAIIATHFHKSEAKLHCFDDLTTTRLTMKPLIQPALALIMILFMGCSAPLSQSIIGTWESTDGPRATVEFEPGGGLKMFTPQQPGIPFDMDTRAASYTTGVGNHFNVLMLGEYYDGVMIQGELLITSRREGVTQHFRRMSPEAVALAKEQALAAEQRKNAETLAQVKTELAAAGIPNNEAEKAAPYITAKLNRGEPLTPEAAAQASAMGIVPIPFSQTVIEEYSNWVHETTEASERIN